MTQEWARSAANLGEGVSSVEPQCPADVVIGDIGIVSVRAGMNATIGDGWPSR